MWSKCLWMVSIKRHDGEPTLFELHISSLGEYNSSYQCNFQFYVNGSQKYISKMSTVPRLRSCALGHVYNSTCPIANAQEMSALAVDSSKNT